jgi:hypothetical protein
MLKKTTPTKTKYKDLFPSTGNLRKRNERKKTMKVMKMVILLLLQRNQELFGRLSSISSL